MIKQKQTRSIKKKLNQTNETKQNRIQQNSTKQKIKKYKKAYHKRIGSN